MKSCCWFNVLTRLTSRTYIRLARMTIPVFIRIFRVSLHNFIFTVQKVPSMNLTKSLLAGAVLSIIAFAGCKKTTQPHRPQLVFKFVFDSTQARLNNFGLPDTMPSNHAGENPEMNVMSAHYIELAQTPTTLLGTGTIVY